MGVIMKVSEIAGTIGTKAKNFINWADKIEVNVSIKNRNSTSTKHPDDSFAKEESITGKQKMSNNVVEEPLSKKKQSGSAKEVVEIEKIVEVPVKPKANLENKPWLKLSEDCVALIDEFDSIKSKSKSNDVISLMEHSVDRLLEIIERCGATRIEENETEFDIARHKAYPPAKVSQGTKIEGVLSPGLAVENRILRRAIVEVGQKN